MLNGDENLQCEISGISRKFQIQMAPEAPMFLHRRELETRGLDLPRVLHMATSEDELCPEGQAISYF